MAPGLARRSRRRGRVGRWGLLPLLFLFLLNQGLAAQTESASHLRLGLTLGGMSLVGVAVEYEREGRSVDLAIGTWSFDDISLSIAAKQYLGVGATRPFVGFGAWGVFASSEEGRGGVLVLRAPVGVDWRMDGDHFLGFVININRGLRVWRTDPDDDTPVMSRLRPLPGLYYRWRR